MFVWGSLILVELVGVLCGGSFLGLMLLRNNRVLESDEDMDCWIEI